MWNQAFFYNNCNHYSIYFYCEEIEGRLVLFFFCIIGSKELHSLNKSFSKFISYENDTHFFIEETEKKINFDL